MCRRCATVQRRPPFLVCRSGPFVQREGPVVHEEALPCAYKALSFKRPFRVQRMLFCDKRRSYRVHRRDPFVRGGLPCTRLRDRSRSRRRLSFCTM